MSTSLAGVLPVVHMPYDDNLSIDWATLEKKVAHIFAMGVDGVCLALVSDLFHLTSEERLSLPAELVRFAKGRGPVVINVGAEGTAQTVFTIGSRKY